MDSPNSEIVVPGQPEPPPIAVDTAEPGVSSPESASEAPATAAPQQHPASSFAADIVSSVQSLIGTIVIAIFVITFVVQAFQIPSESMENTLLVGDYLLVDKLCYGGRGMGDHMMPYRKITRGDVIVFHYPVDPKQHFVKRVELRLELRMEFGEEAGRQQFSGGGIVAFAQGPRKLESFLAITLPRSFAGCQQLVCDLGHRAHYHDRQALTPASDDRSSAINRGGIFHGGTAEFHHDHWRRPHTSTWIRPPSAGLSPRAR